MLGAVLVVNAYPWPKGILKQQNLPEDTFVSHGFAYPVLILAAVAILMTILMTRTRFGRYVFAIAQPRGRGAVGHQRALDDGQDLRADGDTGRPVGRDLLGTPDLGHQRHGCHGRTLRDRRRRHRGHVAGRGRGHHLWRRPWRAGIESLRTGMVLIGFDVAIQNIVVGTVLVFAVYIDTLYRKRVK